MNASDIFYIESAKKTDQIWTVRISKNGGSYGAHATYTAASTTLSGVNYQFNCPVQIPADAIAGDEYRYQLYPQGDDPDTSLDTFYYPTIGTYPVVVGYNKGDIYLGQSGSEILLSPYGRKLKITTREIGRSGETAGGVLQSDIVRVKYRFELPYSAIDTDKLDEIIGLYDLRDELTLKIYITDTDYFLNDDGVAPVVKMLPISRDRLSILFSGIWSNVDLTLEEI